MHSTATSKTTLAQDPIAGNFPSSKLIMIYEATRKIEIFLMSYILRNNYK